MKRLGKIEERTKLKGNISKIQKKNKQEITQKKNCKIINTYLGGSNFSESWL